MLYFLWNTGRWHFVLTVESCKCWVLEFLNLSNLLWLIGSAHGLYQAELSSEICCCFIDTNIYSVFFHHISSCCLRLLHCTRCYLTCSTWSLLIQLQYCTEKIKNDILAFILKSVDWFSSAFSDLCTIKCLNSKHLLHLSLMSDWNMEFHSIEMEERGKADNLLL